MPSVSKLGTVIGLRAALPVNVGVVLRQNRDFKIIYVFLMVLGFQGFLCLNKASSQMARIS